MRPLLQAVGPLYDQAAFEMPARSFGCFQVSRYEAYHATAMHYYEEQNRIAKTTDNDEYICLSI